VHAAAGGLLPSVPSGGALYLAAGIVGATMMPHVVYLHSAMTSRHRRAHTDDASRRHALRVERWDVVVALGLAGLVNMSMLLVAAKAFGGHGGGAAAAGSLDVIHTELGRIAGGGVALAFAGTLLVSGVSSSGVGTLAGQTVMADFVRLRMPLYVRRGLTMAPALLVLALGVNGTAVLNFSQVVLSFGIPFALVPLVLIGRSRRIVGAFANRRATTAGLVLVTALVTALNVALVVGRFG
jgi:manganese transport protein